MPQLPVHSTVTSDGQTMTGGVVSTTVIVTVSVSLSIPSETVSVTTVVPSGNCPTGAAELGSSNVTPGAVHV